MVSKRTPVDSKPRPECTAAEVRARLEAHDQRLARAELEEHHRREASFIACPSSSSLHDARARHARYEALTRDEGDDYDGRTADEKLCIEMADRRGKDFGRQVRRRLYVQDGLRRIEATRRWAYEQRRGALAAIRLRYGRAMPARAFARRSRCMRPRALRTVARAGASGSRAGPSHSSEGDPEPGGSPGAVDELEAVHAPPWRAWGSSCLA